MAWIRSDYERAAVFGEGVSADVQIGDQPFFIKCYREKGRGPSAAGRIRSFSLPAADYSVSPFSRPE